MASLLEPKLLPHLRRHLTDRTEALRKQLWDRAFTNRESDWILKEKLRDFSKPLPGKTDLEPVIVRRARSIAEMLDAMSDPDKSLPTPSYRIFDGELLVGVPTMGSNGIGKVFPEYLDEAEMHMASIANRSELSVLGHNSADYERLVKHGIRRILEFCADQVKLINARVAELDQQPPSVERHNLLHQRDFYEAVTISCEAVVAYARRFADLAHEMAKTEPNPHRQQELREIERICRKVPFEPADTLQEALQSILFVHIGLRAGMDQTSFGRLDQVLEPYLESTVKPGVKDLDKAVELVECFLIKIAWPLNLSTKYLVQQDHADYGVNLGTRQYYTDERANTNNFLQNVVLGGKDSDGNDATVEATHVILQAFANVNLATPGLYVRLHKDSPHQLLHRVARALAVTKNIPVILNDDVIIPGLSRALVEDDLEPTEAVSLANDYVVDGCWEPILNGKSDWTLNMVNGMTMLECALNEGATLDPNPMLLRGGKKCYRTPPVHAYDDLKKALRTSMSFFVHQSAVAMYNYYLLDEFVTPTPLLSAFIGTCLKNGRDKSWGGAQYFLGGTILEGLPNMVNDICAIKKWVFDREKYDLKQVLGALRYDFTAPDGDPVTQATYSDIRSDFFTDSPKFGSDDPEATAVAQWILNDFAEIVAEVKEFADKVYRVTQANPKERERMEHLRQSAGFYGPALDKRLEHVPAIGFTAGLGTFEMYTLLGQGVAASADRRANEPLAQNITPTPGTIDRGYGHILASLKPLDLGRFAAGAVLDLCLEVESTSTEEEQLELVQAVMGAFLRNDGHSLALTLGDRTLFQQIYDTSVRASKMTNAEEASNLLKPYGHVTVRAGGWQTPFISMELDQQKHWSESPITP